MCNEFIIAAALSAQSNAVPSSPPFTHLSAYFLTCHFTAPFVSLFSHVPFYRKRVCARNSLLLLHCVIQPLVLYSPPPPPPTHLSAYFLMCHYTESTQDPFVSLFSHVPFYRECMRVQGIHYFCTACTANELWSPFPLLPECSTGRFDLLLLQKSISHQSDVLSLYLLLVANLASTK